MIKQSSLVNMLVIAVLFCNILQCLAEPTVASTMVDHLSCPKLAKKTLLELIKEARVSPAHRDSPVTDHRVHYDLNFPWIKYIAPVVEYLYYGDSRHSVFASSQDGKSKSLRESDRMAEPSFQTLARREKQKANCTLRNLANQNSTHTGVIIVNDTSLQQLLRHEHGGNVSSQASDNATCQLLLLYAPWCPFSMQIAPHYNALGRIFPHLEALAINAVTLNYWNARFGTVAVPNVLLFHNGKFIAKYNYSEKSVESLTYFIQNFTNLRTTDSIELLDEDFDGPVPTLLAPQTDYYLLLSWAVVVFSLAYGCFLYGGPFASLYHKLANMFNYDHNHMD